MTDNIHTASANVQIIDEAFFIPQLNRTRRIWLYLPAGYAISKKRYPVIYMQDGQNLFDNATSFSGEWEVDETLDARPDACIVVGIDNGGLLRMNEYNPNDTAHFGKGEGFLYLQFIVETLKPVIDRKFRTQSSKKHTIIAGSSMGGLISFYAGLMYPAIFGKMGIFSPSFWVAPGITGQISRLVKARKHSGQEYYFYGGGAENPSMIGDLQKVVELMYGFAGIKSTISINREGWHNEVCWKRAFQDFYSWIN